MDTFRTVLGTAFVLLAGAMLLRPAPFLALERAVLRFRGAHSFDEHRLASRHRLGVFVVLAVGLATLVAGVTS